jgi:phage terminase Nu1 subunit (DNA packaging protein)
MQERARLDRLRADRLQLELDRTRAELVPQSEVARHWRQIEADVRNSLRMIPAIAAKRVVKAERMTEVEHILRDVIHRALTTIAGT